MNKWQALQQFWSSFGVPAYDENVIPTDAKMPYITYEARTDSLDYPVAASASIWYRSDSWQEISEKSDQIATYIQKVLKPIPIEGGYVWIVKGTPFAQRMPDDQDRHVRRMYLNVLIEYLTAD
jgi:hypothetical protein